MTGIELIRRAREQNPGLRVIVISSADFEYARESLRLGVEDYVLKPFHPAALEMVQRLRAKSPRSGMWTMMPVKRPTTKCRGHQPQQPQEPFAG